MLPPILLYLLFLALRPATFGSGDTLLLIFVHSIQTTIVAWGLLFNLTVGTLDFSIGAEVSLAGIVGVILSGYMGVAGIVVGALGCVVVTGVFKAVLMDVVKTNAMVNSIAFTYIFASITTIVSKQVNLSIPSSMTVLGKTPVLIAIFVVMGAVMYLLNRFSILGARARAAGGSESIAKATGISSRKVKAIAILIASLYMAVAAVIQVSRGAGAATTNGLESLSTVFSSMMAVFISLTLSNYVDGTIGCIVGALCFSVLDIGLISVNMPSNYKNVFIGAGLLILLWVFNAHEQKLRHQLLRQQSRERHSRIKPNAQPETE